MSDQEMQELYNECLRAFIEDWKQQRPCLPMTKEEIRERVAQIFNGVLKELS